MSTKEIELACNILEINLNDVDPLRPEPSKRKIKEAYESRLIKCLPDSKGRMYTTEFKAVQAAYNTLLGMLPKLNKSNNSSASEMSSALLKAHKREDPTYKVDLTKSAAKYDPNVFNALFEASKQRTLATSSQKSSGHIAPMESSPSLASCLKVKLNDDNNCIQVLKSSKKVTSNNYHFSVSEFDREAQKTIVCDKVDNKQLSQYQKEMQKGTSRMANNELTHKAKQLKKEYDTYVRVQADRDQPMFSRLRG